MDQQSNLSQLPSSWVWTDLRSLTQNLDGKRIPVNEKDRKKMQGSYPYYGASGIIDHVDNYLFDGDFMLIGEDGANLLSRSTPIAFLATGKFWVNNHAHILTTYGQIPLKYIISYINSISLARWVTGTAQPKLNQARMNTIPIPLAPFQEQQRIVAKIEELFSFLDAGTESLRKVRAQLKRYHQAALKHAFEGKLTRIWRETQGFKLQKEFSEIIADLRSQERPDVTSMGQIMIPKEWEWVNIGNISESIKNGVYKPKDFFDTNGIACLRMYNIKDGKIIWKDIKRLNLNKEEIDFYELKADDILISRVNSKELVGKAAAVPLGLEKCVFEAMTIRLRLIRDYANTKYVNFWFLFSGKRFFNRNAQQTVGMASINQEQIKSMPVPFCHPIEQAMIAQEIERLFSIAEEAEKYIANSLEQAEILRQSILKKAFEGELVPQNPTDEPAEKLLARIKGERISNDKCKTHTQLEVSGYAK